MKIFITHYTPLIDRRQHIIDQLKNHGITDYEFIETHDRDVLSDIETKKFVGMHPSVVSLFLKHVQVWKKQIDDIVVVLEDDAILADDFTHKLNHFVKSLEGTDWDVVFSGECCGIHAHNIVQGQIFYETRTSRGTCMYILNRHVSTKLYNTYTHDETVIEPVDHWFNRINRTGEFKYLFSEPTIVGQGSETNLFYTSLTRHL